MLSIAVETTTSLSLKQQPDIGYAPDYEKYQARVKRRITSEKLTKSLPEGFPDQLTSAIVWEGKDIQNQTDWAYVLSSADIDEIENALSQFKGVRHYIDILHDNECLLAAGSGFALGFLTAETFPLPNLHSRLRNISKELHTGRGFKVIRGVPVERYPREDAIIIFAGISSHIAPVRARQDNVFEGRPADVVLNHIKDLSNTVDSNRIGAPAYTAEKQVFHTDVGDIISLFSLSTSEEGGESKLSSSWRVYNELAKNRPDLIRTLSEPRPAEEYGSPNSFTLRPLLHFVPRSDGQEEKLIIQYARRTFTGYQALPRNPNIPPISEAQAEALDALHFLAERYAVSLEFQAGDILYANNLSIFHARDGFRDSISKQRHLVRLWLRDPEYAWPTPPALQSRWDRVYANVTAEASVFPLEPRIRSASNGKASK